MPLDWGAVELNANAARQHKQLRSVSASASAVAVAVGAASGGGAAGGGAATGRREAQGGGGPPSSLSPEGGRAAGTGGRKFRHTTAVFWPDEGVSGVRQTTRYTSYRPKLREGEGEGEGLDTESVTLSTPSWSPITDVFDFEEGRAVRSEEEMDVLRPPNLPGPATATATAPATDQMEDISLDEIRAAGPYIEAADSIEVAPLARRWIPSPSSDGEQAAEDFVVEDPMVLLQFAEAPTEPLPAGASPSARVDSDKPARIEHPRPALAVPQASEARQPPEVLGDAIQVGQSFVSKSAVQQFPPPTAVQIKSPPEPKQYVLLTYCLDNHASLLARVVPYPSRAVC
jgi:hypothetical protein